MGNKPLKNSTAGWPTRVLRTFPEIAVARGLQGSCDGVNHPYGVVDSDGKRISKTFAEIALCLRYQSRHHKQVMTQEMCKIRNVN